MSRIRPCDRVFAAHAGPLLPLIAASRWLTCMGKRLAVVVNISRPASSTIGVASYSEKAR